MMIGPIQHTHLYLSIIYSRSFDNGPHGETEPTILCGVKWETGLRNSLNGSLCQLGLTLCPTGGQSWGDPGVWSQDVPNRDTHGSASVHQVCGFGLPTVICLHMSSSVMFDCVIPSVAGFKSNEYATPPKKKQKKNTKNLNRGTVNND